MSQRGLSPEGKAKVRGPPKRGQVIHKGRLPCHLLNVSNASTQQSLRKRELKNARVDSGRQHCLRAWILRDDCAVPLVVPVRKPSMARFFVSVYFQLNLGKREYASFLRQTSIIAFEERCETKRAHAPMPNKAAHPIRSPIPTCTIY